MVIKFGVYGFVVVVVSSGAWGVFFSVWCLLGGFLCLLCCCCFGDVKMVVAYSSIVHIAICIFICGFGLSCQLYGVIIIVLMHGLVASRLFFGFGCIRRDVSSRSFVNISRFLSPFVFGGLAYLLLWVFNMGFPLLGGFIGELEGFYSLVFILGGLGVVFVFIFMFGGCCFNLFILVVMCGSSELSVDVRVLCLFLNVLLLSVMYLLCLFLFVYKIVV